MTSPSHDNQGSTAIDGQWSYGTGSVQLTALRLTVCGTCRERQSLKDSELRADCGDVQTTTFVKCCSLTMVEWRAAFVS